MRAHWFWLCLTIACLVWYATITVYVSVKGARDVRSMLSRLGAARPRPAKRS